ncbi:MAG: tRNA glutamyl-Q(34) synthetase GluQRS [Gammaproteobacteria bacterium]|nr:tRNA glutamyl-Q(34) synthetase GluQRS [Gammaproteobacteria bacterium]MDH5734879.1 tRNA glutamyl-Q(34) synthetase GluQRS [Gammaproteobacteria bacterium]
MSDSNFHYRGRFAPSPTGQLHFGSLVTAVASYLEARSQKGDWLVRIEDIDELRNIPGSADDILRTLERYGFEWDDDILYQTRRKQIYEDVLQALIDKKLIYRCICSRKDLRENNEMGQQGLAYPGTCEDKNHPEDIAHALRIRTSNQIIEFSDAIMGVYTQNLKQEIGDFIIRRRDGLFAYQLAVVIDDAFQNITHVVRGVDLLDSTPRQIFLQQHLSYTQPAYAHLPVAVDAQGDKISKHNGSGGIDQYKPVPALFAALRFLGQQPDPALTKASLNTIWQWALEHWNMNKIPAIEKIPYTD